MADKLPSPNMQIIQTVIAEFKETDFSDLKLIGKGGQANVYKAFNGSFGDVVLKMYTHSIEKEEATMKEINLLMKHSKHPNIVQVFGLLNDDTDSNRCLGFIMENMESGSLHQVIHSPDITYTYGNVYSWIQKAARGLQHLHNEGIFHRDIKPSNILVGGNLDVIKICDLGHARILDNESRTGGVGTSIYMAPEVALNSKKYAIPADIYSFSVTVWEMFHRIKPYYHLGEIENYPKMRCIFEQGERPVVDKELDPEIVGLIITGWDALPEKRPPLSQFLETARKLGKEHGGKVIPPRNGDKVAEETLRAGLEQMSVFETASGETVNILMVGEEEAELEELLTISIKVFNSEQPSRTVGIKNQLETSFLGRIFRFHQLERTSDVHDISVRKTINTIGGVSLVCLLLSTDVWKSAQILSTLAILAEKNLIIAAHSKNTSDMQMKKKISLMYPSTVKAAATPFFKTKELFDTNLEHKEKKQAKVALINACIQNAQGATKFII